ncbi:MAG: Uma2 family endonuclease [Aestuariivita sp.]|nr:Uma2 family endonuclease [Aestuariivita sp.]MCY4346703.1 Uma2 family endonuclease [Aestuariivita sp.]
MPAFDPTERPATYEDVLDAPPNQVAEVLAGTLYTQPRPASRHALASSGILAKINPPFNYGDGGPGGWWIIFEPELHLGEDIVVPDLAGWRRTTMPSYPDAAYFEIAPDWVCEVVSPSTRRIDQNEKRAIYAREIVSHLWFVDPDAQTLEIFERQKGQWLPRKTLAGDAAVSQPPFEAISFRLHALWP